VILRAKQLIRTLAETVGQAQTKTYCDKLRDVNIETIIDTLGGVEARILVKSCAATVLKVETTTVVNTLGQLQAEALIDTPGAAVA